MRRKKRGARRPFPLGAVFLLLVVGGVIAVILWPSPRDRPLKDEPVEKSDATATQVERRVVLDLRERIRFLLESYRLPVGPGSEGVDLVCAVPPGRSVFAVNGALTQAVELWGGRVSGGTETSLPGGRRRVDLTMQMADQAAVVGLSSGSMPERAGAIALVVDDFGYLRDERFEEFLRLPVPFTPSILPGLDLSAETAERFLAAGIAPLLHLPMEPLDAERFDPGPGAVRVGMSRGAIGALLEMHLVSLPGVIGVNHHMGSRGSAESSVVGPVLDTVGGKGLFYLDSGTSDHTVCPAEAAARGVACLSADLFLDGEGDRTREAMEGNLREAAELALANGDAILIGHARPATLEFLETASDSLAAWGCHWVRLEELLR